MRKNVFLHFVNRESREIYGLFHSVPDDQHYLALLYALKISVLICEEHCIVPPQFGLECPIARRALSERKIFRQSGLIIYPMRERSPGDLLEKKRHDYAPYRDRFSDIFLDEAVQFLTDGASTFLQRDTEIGKGLADAWQIGPDRKRGLWNALKTQLKAPDLEAIRHIPAQLIEQGIAATWPAIHDRLPPAARSAGRELRRISQHEYFRMYVKHHDLRVIRGLPLMFDDFALESKENYYNYRFIAAAFGALYLRQFLLLASSQTVVELKSEHGFIDFLDLLADLSGIRGTGVTDLQYILNRASRAVGFGWGDFASELIRKSNNTDVTLTSRELRELGDAFGGVCTEVRKAMDLPSSRAASTKLPTASRGRGLRIKTSEKRQIINIRGDVIMGNKIQANQIGVYNESGEVRAGDVVQSASGTRQEMNFDLPKLTDDLAKTIGAAKASAESSAQFAELASLSKAHESASAGDKGGVISALKGVGHWTLELAQKAGASVLAELVKKQLGL
jgi:hypothetical protein